MTRLWQLLLLLFGGVSASFFEGGFDHHYTYSSESDILGLHNVTTVVKFRIRNVNSTDDGGSLHMLMVDSFTQHAEKGYFADNPMKLDLDKGFLFTVGGDGLVTMVYYHPEDKHEILSLKKVLASVLSVRVVIRQGSQWHFTSEELDHTGKLEHEYEVEKMAGGLKFVRTHRSSKEVLRHHTKILQLDHSGTPFHIESLDNVTLHSDKTEMKRKFVEGEAEIIDEQSGDFPKIASVSKTKVKLSAKRLHNSPSYVQTAQLTKDSIFVKRKELEKVPLTVLEEDIKKQIGCIHLYSNKFERNRTECVNKLRQLLLSLHQDDFLKLGTDIVTRTCVGNMTMCLDERDLFIDMIAREGSHKAQKLLLDFLILQSNVSEEGIRRFLFHCIALKNPLPELVQVVENLCHGGIEYLDGTPSLTKTGKRACLSLGAIAKSLHEINVTESDRIVERLESWLEPHNQTQSSQIIKPRQRRSIAQYDRVSRKHIETKTVLLQSLGNAGKKRSLNHIKSYLEPNVGTSVWRRAAANSLRHFTCNESATALLRTAVHDAETVVRQTATKVLEKHPQSKSITQEQADIVLSKNYTYPVIARVRRDLLQTLKQGINVHIEPPGIEWEKTIGTSKIGASFGLHIRNILDLKLGLLDGHFTIDVFDDAHAEAHVGLLNFQVEIVKATICFKGHIEYNLNVLKDFGISSLQDLVHIYDKIVGKIVDPIKRAVKSFNDIIHLFKNGGIKKIFNTLVSTVKNLPHTLGEVAVRLKEFVEEVFSLAGSTILDEIKHVVTHMRQFVDGIRQDVLKFYHDVVDPVTMALPYIGKKITEAFNLIVNGFKHLFDNPMQSISAMFRAITEIKMAVAMVADVKGKIVEACMFLKGRATEWFNTAKEVPKIIRRLQDAVQKLVSSAIHRRSLGDDMGNSFNNGVQSMKDAYVDLKIDLKAKWDRVIAPISALINVAKPFLDEFKAIVDLVKGIKFAYKKLKEVIEKGKGLIQKVFGPKFDLKFPTYRRPKKDNCPEGVWPTTTNDHYQTTGVDLTLGRGQTIAAPVDGIVHVNSGTKVVIEPTDPEFAGQEIIIENIKPERNANGKRFKSGKKIGQASRVGFCKPNFIHVSVRKAQNTTKQDSDYDYIDPSSYLDRLVPVPKWIQECNDHEFRYIGQTFDSGESTDDEPQSASEKLKRAWEDSIGSHDDLDARMGAEDTAYRPEDDGLYDSTSFRDSLKNSLKKQAAAFADFFKTALFSNDGPKVPNILEIVDVNGKNVLWVLDKLDDGSELSKKFNAIFMSLKRGMTEIPSGNPTTLPLPFIRRLLSPQGDGSVTGGIADVATQLTVAVENKCPFFRGAIASGFGHICTARCDCLGLSCNIALHQGYKTEYLMIQMHLDIDEAKMKLAFNGTTFDLIADGDDHDIDLSVALFNMKTSLAVQFSRTGGNYSLSLEAKLCSDFLMTCLPPVQLFSEIRFPSVKPIETADCKTGGIDRISDVVDKEIHAMSIPAFINNLADYNKLNHDVTKVLDNVRTTVVKSLMEDGVDKLGDVVKEFKDKVDFCLSANIPVPPFDVSFFDLRYHFVVGPVPLSLGFGAGGSVGFGVKLGFCILSMTVKTTLTPWVGGKVWGDAAVDIGIARGGIRLKGYLLETKFPITVELVFSKYPLDIG